MFETIKGMGIDALIAIGSGLFAVIGWVATLYFDVRQLKRDVEEIKQEHKRFGEDLQEIALLLGRIEERLNILKGKNS